MDVLEHNANTILLNIFLLLSYCLMLNACYTEGKCINTFHLCRSLSLPIPPSQSIALNYFLSGLFFQLIIWKKLIEFTYTASHFCDFISYYTRQFGKKC